MPTKLDIQNHVKSLRVTELIISDLITNASDNVQDYLYPSLYNVRADIRHANNFLVTNTDWDNEVNTNDYETMFIQN